MKSERFLAQTFFITGIRLVTVVFRTLRSLSNQQRGILRLRDNEMVLTALNKNLNKPDNTKGKPFLYS